MNELIEKLKILTVSVPYGYKELDSAYQRSAKDAVNIIEAHTCEWEREDYDRDIYITECGKGFEFYEGNPEDNQFKHCPYCQGRIMEAEK